MGQGRGVAGFCLGVEEGDGNLGLLEFVLGPRIPPQGAAGIVGLGVMGDQGVPELLGPRGVLLDSVIIASLQKEGVGGVGARGGVAEGADSLKQGQALGGVAPHEKRTPQGPAGLGGGRVLL